MLYFTSLLILLSSLGNHGHMNKHAQSWHLPSFPHAYSKSKILKMLVDYSQSNKIQHNEALTAHPGLASVSHRLFQADMPSPASLLRFMCFLLAIAACLPDNGKNKGISNMSNHI